MNNNISEHISYYEATRSHDAVRYGIDNTPNEIQLTKMRTVAIYIFEPTRRHFNVPIYVSSFFRCKELNKKKGSKTSQHPKGEAIDLDDVLGRLTNKQIFYYIVENLNFDQIIWEFGNDENPNWVHISYVSANQNRKKITISYKKGKKTKYKHFKTIKELDTFKENLYKNVA